MSSSAQAPRRWLDHVVAVWITFHLVVVVLHLIPTPPRTDKVALEIPEAAQEIDNVVQTLHGTGWYDGSPEELREDLIAVVKRYKRWHTDATWFTRVYLDPIRSKQTWNMFGGGAKAHPKVMVVEIRPEGSETFEVFQDGRWGGTVLGHRHRKVRRGLSLRGRTRQRREYAAFLARWWDDLHPDRPAAEVHMVYVVRDTLPAAQVRQGVEAPEKRELSFRWKVPR